MTNFNWRTQLKQIKIIYIINSNFRIKLKQINTLGPKQKIERMRTKQKSSIYDQFQLEDKIKRNENLCAKKLKEPKINK